MMHGDPGLAEREPGIAGRQLAGAEHLHPARRQAGVQRLREQAVVQAAAGQYHGVAAGQLAPGGDPVGQRGGQCGLEAGGAAHCVVLVGEALVTNDPVATLQSYLSV